jgi:hypothetical protein
MCITLWIIHIGSNLSALLSYSFFPLLTLLFDLASNPGHFTCICKQWNPSSVHLRALAADALYGIHFPMFREKREKKKQQKHPHSRSPIFNLLHWVSTVFPNARIGKHC